MFCLNKKGVLTTYMLIFVILSVGMGLFFFTGEDIERYYTLGDLHINLLNSYGLAEKELYVYDENLKIKISDSIQTLASKGGVLERDSIGGYSYWQKGEIKCYPSQELVLNNLGDLLNQEDSSSELEVDYVGGKILVNQEYNQKYNQELSKINSEYIIDLTLRTDYDYPLSLFSETVSVVEMLVESCGNNITCWGHNDISLETIDQGNIFKIELTSQDMKDFWTDKEVVIKGAIDFEYNPLEEGNFQC